MNDRPETESSGHILIMEDEAVIRGLLVKTLERNGFRVSDAADGRAALEIYRSCLSSGSPPDLVILDLIVPGGMGGKATLTALREFAPDAKVIIASGCSDERELDELREEGRTAILNKPYDIRHLIACVKALHDRPERPGEG